MTARRFSAVAYPVLALDLLLIGFNCLDTGLLLSLGNVYAVVAAVQIPLYLLPYFVYFRFREKPEFAPLGLGVLRPRRHRPHTVLRLGLALLGMLLTAGALLQIFLYRVGAVSYAYVSAPANDAVREQIHPVLTVLVLAVLPALMEELVFRGILFRDLLREGFRPGIAALATSLLFAMMHFDLAFFPVYLLGGLLFTLLSELSGSLAAAMLLHASYNVLSLFGAGVLQMLSRQAATATLSALILTLVFLGCSYVALGAIRKILRAREAAQISQTAAAQPVPPAPGAFGTAQTVPPAPGAFGAAQTVPPASGAFGTAQTVPPQPGTSAPPMRLRTQFLRCFGSPAFLLCVAVFFAAAILLPRILT